MIQCNINKTSDLYCKVEWNDINILNTIFFDYLDFPVTHLSILFSSVNSKLYVLHNLFRPSND